jgi:hypothetical protein
MYGTQIRHARDILDATFFLKESCFIFGYVIPMKYHFRAASETESIIYHYVHNSRLSAQAYIDL